MDDELPLNSPIMELDTKDPVFDSESEDDNVSYSVIDVEKRERMVETFSWSPQGRGVEMDCRISIEDFRVRIKNLCQDYFLDHKAQDFINGLRSISCPSLHNLVVVIAIRMSLDYSTTVQQQVSALLTILKDSNLITQQQIEDGLEKLIQSIDDICLDAPFSPERLECLVDCAILDGVIPSNFRCRYPETFLNKLIELRTASDISSQEDVSNETNGLIHHLNALKAFKSFIVQNEEDLFSSGLNSTEVEKILIDAHTSAYRTSFWNGIDWSPGSFMKQDFKDNNFYPSTLCFNHEFVKSIIIASMSRSCIQRELVSSGLNYLCPTIIDTNDISLGFMRILGNLDDLSLDVVNACDLTTKFITRCIVDELLPPSFVTVNLILHMGGPGGTQTLNMSDKFLRNKPRNVLRHQTKNVWSQDIETKETVEFKLKVSEILNSYNLSFDKRECIKSLHLVSTKQKNKVSVVQYIVLFFIEQNLLDVNADSGTTHQNGIFEESCNKGIRTGISLLEYLLSQGFIDEEIIIDGFQMSIEKIPDLAVMNSRAHELFSEFVTKAKERALLPLNWKSK
ncbi:MA3 domain-containing protein [Cryptosporidium felis]|nr:MA3 domain-containing protein [Cryptosporidium felis]